jgi:hypothetical protein
MNKIKVRRKYTGDHSVIEMPAERVIECFVYSESNSTECQIKELNLKIEALQKILAMLLTEEQLKELVGKTWGLEVV